MAAPELPRIADGQPVDVCYGETGALTRIDPSGQKAPRRVLATCLHGGSRRIRGSERAG